MGVITRHLRTYLRPILRWAKTNITLRRLVQRCFFTPQENLRPRMAWLYALLKAAMTTASRPQCLWALCPWLARCPADPADFMDLPFYAQETGMEFSSPAQAYQHFMAHGQAAGLHPSPFFYTRWYCWQHPETAAYPSALDHFARHAAYRPLDPAPFLDGTAYLQTHTHYHSMVDALIALTQGQELSLSPRLEDHLTALAQRQQSLQQAITAHILRQQPTDRRRLVWVQAGPRFAAQAQLHPEPHRSWDLMCNWYDTHASPEQQPGEIHMLQTGTKATGINYVLTHCPDLLLRYDQVLFLDDDLFFEPGSIDRLFAIATRDRLDLFQAALCSGSYGSWLALYRKKSYGTRCVTGVEIMMPGFSREALRTCANLFGRNVSGYGLDFLFSERIRRRGGRLGVIDDVAVRHQAPIDEAHGAYYAFLRGQNIPYKLELYSAICQCNCYPQFIEIP